MLFLGMSGFGLLRGGLGGADGLGDAVGGIGVHEGGSRLLLALQFFLLLLFLRLPDLLEGGLLELFERIERFQRLLARAGNGVVHPSHSGGQLSGGVLDAHLGRGGRILRSDLGVLHPDFGHSLHTPPSYHSIVVNAPSRRTLSRSASALSVMAATMRPG